MAQLTINCVEHLERTVIKTGNSCIVRVPSGWLGKKVTVARTEE